ncbi:hypothetical protein [Rheinheimera sp. UJ63]|uniref:hypothetical protein n=1 Tax=Rheinheimera sp. UJ63 TaxID=2910157 RepID=UPI001F3CC9BC|nr:hypothetical protein [Rheinheimera sp. UJ63]MCF4010807.1 hypothetical protein [Rheinheimera sp. UJ63]
MSSLIEEHQFVAGPTSLSKYDHPLVDIFFSSYSKKCASHKEAYTLKTQSLAEYLCVELATTNI